MPDSTDTNWISGKRTKMPDSNSSESWQPFLKKMSTDPEVKVDMRP